MWVDVHLKGVGMSLNKEVQTSRDSTVVKERGRMEVKGEELCGALGLSLKADGGGGKYCLFSHASLLCLSFGVSHIPSITTT